MSNNSIPVIKFVFRGELKALDEAINIKPGYEVEEFTDPNELATFLTTLSAGLIIASLRDKNDLVQIAILLKTVKKVAKDIVMKVVVVNFSGDKNLEKASGKLGILDVVEPGMNTRALKFKLDFWMKSLNAQIKNIATSSSNSLQNSKTSENKVLDKKQSGNQTPNWLDPLDLESDMWLLKNENDCKKILSKWLIKLTGPGPYVGQWSDVKPGLWRYDFKDEQKDLFVPTEGSWFFNGDQKPEFIWKENTWLIAGDNFNLFFKSGSEVHSRLNLKEKKLTVCKNSLFAKTKEAVIIESFDKDLVFKQQADNLENLEGKNKTDQLDGGPLSGKNQAEDHIDGNLSGEVEGEGDIGSDSLSQKTKTDKKSGYWNNKNSYSDEFDPNLEGPKSDGFNDGPGLERERSDLEHKKYYKNHNEAQQYDTLEEKERRKREGQKESGDLSGKSNTDDISSYYGNKKSKSEKEEKESKEDDLYTKSESAKKKSQFEKNGKDHQNENDKDRSYDRVGEEKSSKDLARERAEKLKSIEAERERKDAEEEENKKRSTLAEKEKQLALERARDGEEDKASKDRNERELKSQETDTRRRKERHDNQSELKGTRKENREESLERDSKTNMEKGWEGDHDYGMDGASSTDKLGGHYKSKTDSLEKDKKNRSEESSSLNNILPLIKNADAKKSKDPQDLELEKIIMDSKVSALLSQGDLKIQCELDDFFDEKIFFKTDVAGIRTSANIDLDMIFRFFEKESKLKMQGDVVSVESDGEGNSFVTVKINTNHANSLNLFMKLYEARQKNINEFIKKAKGF